MKLIINLQKNVIVSVKICPVYKRWKICKTCEKSANFDGGEIPAWLQRHYRFLNFHIQLNKSVFQWRSGNKPRVPIYFICMIFFFLNFMSFLCWMPLELWQNIQTPWFQAFIISIQSYFRWIHLSFILCLLFCVLWKTNKKQTKKHEKKYTLSKC